MRKRITDVMSTENGRALLLSAVYAFVLLFLLSPDSYIRDLYCRADSAVFFMCGKAWMCGMTPYVDFNDSKGPLLWLVYGIGYLLSHHSYVGVFWMSVPFFTATLFVAYKLCRLYSDARVAATATAALPLFLFLFWFHFEIRAEDFCYPFVMISLYCVCRVLRWRDDSPYLWLSVAMGVCFGCTLLIKYSTAAMIAVPMAVVLYMSIRHRRFLASLAGMAAGIVVTTLPFVIYFAIVGNLGAFIEEYFLHTFQTIENINSDHGSAMPLNIHLGYVLHFTFIAILVGIVVFCVRYKTGWWPAVCYLLFLTATAMGVQAYYVAVTLPFGIFLLLPAVDIVYARATVLRRHAALCCLLCAVLAIAYNIRPINTAFRLCLPGRQEFYRMEYIMAQVDKPKVMFSLLDCSIGITANSLPACTNYTHQEGLTASMVESRLQALRERRPDFIILDDYPVEGREINEENVRQYGYVLYYKTTHTLGADNHFILYGKPGLRLPPADFHVSDWDIWLKRNIFGI